MHHVITSGSLGLVLTFIIAGCTGHDPDRVPLTVSGAINPSSLAFTGGLAELTVTAQGSGVVTAMAASIDGVPVALARTGDTWSGQIVAPGNGSTLGEDAVVTVKLSAVDHVGNVATGVALATVHAAEQPPSF